MPFFKFLFLNFKEKLASIVLSVIWEFLETLRCDGCRLQGSYGGDRN